ncbi:Protein bicaudal C [Armadillidium vulgare]|nr:Protein bicaudal C [Armadillidium vulgare]
MVVVDYVLKKMLAAKAMKQPIQSEPRVPTSVWSGYGFSKSNPLFSISQLIKDELAYDLYRSEILLRPKPLFDSSVSRDLDSNLSKSIFGKSVSSDVTSTLLCLQLEQYADIFASQEIDYDKFITLNDQDLKDLGLNVYGHRRKLLLAIRELALEREANFMKV